MTSCFLTDTSLYNYELLINSALQSAVKYGSCRIELEIINMTFRGRTQQNEESNGTQSSLQDSYIADTDAPCTFSPMQPPRIMKKQEAFPSTLSLWRHSLETHDCFWQLATGEKFKSSSSQSQHCHCHCVWNEDCISEGTWGHRTTKLNLSIEVMFSSTMLPVRMSGVSQGEKVIEKSGVKWAFVSQTWRYIKKRMEGLGI